VISAVFVDRLPGGASLEVEVAPPFVRVRGVLEDGSRSGWSDWRLVPPPGEPLRVSWEGLWRKG